MTTNLIVGTTAAEAEALAATAAALAAGKDPFGDDDDDESAAAALSPDDDDADTDAAAAGAEADGEADTGADDGADTGLTPEQLAAVAADEPAAELAPEAPRFKAQSPAEFAEARKALLEKRAKGLKDLMDGVIEPDAYSLIDGEVFDALEALTVQRTLHEANTQREASTQEQVLDAIMTQAKEAGTVDYSTNARAAARFDAEMTLLATDGVKRTYAAQAALAHKNVLTVLGITAKPAADKKPEPAQPRENGKPPLTLRNAPAAAMPNTGGDWRDAIGKLTGQDYEAAYAKLTPAQRASLLDD